MAVEIDLGIPGVDGLVASTLSPFVPLYRAVLPVSEKNRKVFPRKTGHKIGLYEPIKWVL